MHTMHEVAILPWRVGRGGGSGGGEISSSSTLLKNISEENGTSLSFCVPKVMLQNGASFKIIKSPLTGPKHPIC